MRSLKTACTTPLLLTLSMLFYSSAHQVDTLDAFTSASKRMQVKAGLVSSSMLAIQWYEWWEDDKDVDAYQIKWGTKDSVYTDSISLQPYTEKIVNTSVIEGLQPATTYYAEFYRVYNEVAYTTPFSFTTLAATNIFHQPDKNSLTLPENVSDIIVFSIDGRQIARQTLTPGRTVSNMLSNLTTPGMYLVSYRAGKKQVKSERILVGR